MNVKIQGGGNGTYANTGSCVPVTNYLQHEDLERMKKGEEVQPFFNQFQICFHFLAHPAFCCSLIFFNSITYVVP